MAFLPPKNPIKFEGDTNGTVEVPLVLVGL